MSNGNITAKLFDFKTSRFPDRIGETGLPCSCALKESPFDTANYKLAGLHSTEPQS